MSKLHNSGGARPGAGRKSFWGEPTHSMRLPESIANNISLIANAPNTAMVIWWTTQQDCERSQDAIEPGSEIADLFNDRCGRPGGRRVWTNLTLNQPIKPPQSKEDIAGILISVETAKQICYLPGIWQIIPKSWIAPK